MPDLIPADIYNYRSFTRETVIPMLHFETGPALGQAVPDFPLWQLDGAPTSLAEWWQRHDYTVIEFGSFT
jgi:hypothetical protein